MPQVIFLLLKKSNYPGVVIFSGNVSAEVIKGLSNYDKKFNHMLDHKELIQIFPQGSLLESV